MAWQPIKLTFFLVQWTRLTATPVGPLQHGFQTTSKQNYSKTSEMRRYSENDRSKHGAARDLSGNTLPSKNQTRCVCLLPMKISKSFVARRPKDSAPYAFSALPISLQPSEIVKTIEGVLNNICKIFADVPGQKEFRLLAFWYQQRELLCHSVSRSCRMKLIEICVILCVRLD